MLVGGVELNGVGRGRDLQYARTVYRDVVEVNDIERLGLQDFANRSLMQQRTASLVSRQGR